MKHIEYFIDSHVQPLGLALHTVEVEDITGIPTQILL